MLPQTVGLLKIKLNWFCMTNIQGSELYTGDLIKYTFDTGLHADAYDSNFFQTMYDDTQNYTNLMHAKCHRSSDTKSAGPFL